MAVGYLLFLQEQIKGIIIIIIIIIIISIVVWHLVRSQMKTHR
jgi:hypothetical protein